MISFAYDAEWIGASAAFPLDPALPLYEGDQYTATLPGVFADAAPDRWGRTLQERREALRARREERRPELLDEWDFLLGVDDRTRMGAVRLTRPGEAGFVAERGDPEAIAADLEQLLRRLIFNLLVGNRDDHLRNHGFLRTAGGWRLAPAFDVNPSPGRLEHSLAIDEIVRIPDLDLVRATVPHYRLSAEQVERLIAEVGDAVGRWPELAQRAGIARDEIERVGTAFASP